MTTSALTANSVTLGYGGQPIINDLTITIPSGRVTTLIGPNGCGKSTLLRSFVRLLTPEEGELHIHGRPLSSFRRRDFARTVAFLPQHPVTPSGVTVRELVGRGRFAHQSLLRPPSADDHAAVDRALHYTGLQDLASRPVQALSGGQRQRAWIATVLAQEADIVILDEPTTYVDIAHQLEIVDLLTDLNRRHGTTMVMVLHDLNIAARCSDYLVALAGGTVVATGSPQEVLTAQLCRQIFGFSAVELDHPAVGHRVIAGQRPQTSLSES